MTGRHVASAGDSSARVIGTYARYVGRVGALAVALGVGGALAGGHGTAGAAPDTGASNDSQPVRAAAGKARDAERSVPVGRRPHGHSTIPTPVTGRRVAAPSGTTGGDTITTVAVTGTRPSVLGLTPVSPSVTVSPRLTAAATTSIEPVVAPEVFVPKPSTTATTGRVGPGRRCCGPPRFPRAWRRLENSVPPQVSRPNQRRRRCWSRSWVGFGARSTTPPPRYRRRPSP